MTERYSVVWGGDNAGIYRESDGITVAGWYRLMRDYGQMPCDVARYWSDEAIQAAGRKYDSRAK